MRKTINWTEEMNAKIRNEFPTVKTSKLAKEMGINASTIRSRATFLGVRKSPLFRGRKNWTAKENELMELIYPHISTEEVANQLNRSIKSVYAQAWLLGISKSDEYTRSLKIKSGEQLKKVGVKTRFKKGSIPQNKGKKLSKEMYEKLKPTMFKQGHRPYNFQPIGHRRITKDGYIEVKVGEHDRFDLLHRFIWKVWVGPIPEGHIVSFKDGDKMNCDINNLHLMTQEQNMLNNSIQRYPDDIRNTMIALGRFKSKLKSITK